MVDSENKTVLVNVQSGMPQVAPLFVSDDCFTALLFKVDKKVREAFQMAPNPLVDSKKLFKHFWKRISLNNEEKTEMALVSGG